MTSSVRYALVDKCAPAVERDPVIEQQDIACFEPKPHVQRLVLGQCFERIEGFPLSRGEARRLRRLVGAVDEHPQEVGTEPPVPLREHRELAKRQGVALIHRVTQIRKRLAQHSEHVWLLTAGGTAGGATGCGGAPRNALAAVAQTSNALIALIAMR